MIITHIYVQIKLYTDY